MRIIINADDFGFNASVNESIIALLSNRIIKSATLIANAPAFDDAARAALKFKDCSFGVHLNVTEFEPLTPIHSRAELTSILNGVGFFDGEEKMRTIGFTSSLREALFRELCLQVERIMASGIRVSHFDSHNHIHTMPIMFPVLKRLQKHFGVRKVRNTWNVYPCGAPKPITVLWKKRLWEWALRYYYRTSTTSAFTSFEVFLDVMRNSDVDCATIELMVHPGHKEFEKEIKLLSEDWHSRMPFSTELISYHEL
jgi:predicted glycoside hydrolase/deacetylase ChbG (UPF0249 family)